MTKKVTIIKSHVEELVNRDWLYVSAFENFYAGNEEEAAKIYGVSKDLLDDIEAALKYLANDIAESVTKDLKELLSLIEN